MIHKSKHLLVLLLKLIVVGGAFYYIYNRLTSGETMNKEVLLNLLENHFSIYSILLVLLLTVLNRFFEILKWQNLVQIVQPISLSESTQQVLGALTAGIFTPNGLGEYAGKAIFYKKNLTKTILFLNLVCNGIQMLISVVFGVIGLVIFAYYFDLLNVELIFSLLIGLTLIVVVAVLFKKWNIKGYSLHQLQVKLNRIPKAIHLKNAALGIARYLVFSHQYFLFFYILGATASYWLLMAAITGVYLVASIIPSFQFLDFAVKGSIAIYFFHFLGINDWVVAFITTAMWFLNVVLPVLWGSYYVMRFKWAGQIEVPSTVYNIES